MNPLKSYIRDIKQLDTLQNQWAHHQRIPASPVQYGAFPGLNPRILDALKTIGITKPYSHQAEAVAHIRNGKNVVVVTPTASGKTEIFNTPIMEALLTDPDAKALYLFPLKALEQDQLQRFETLSQAIPGEQSITAAIYDGDTSAYKRAQIRQNFPNVIFTNPDMLHLGIMAFRSAWEGFFENLKYIVVDELHTYRGIFGCHLVQLFRRLNRICRYYGQKPQYICLSATINNPVELAEDLTGMPFELVDKSGAPQPERHFLFLNPILSPNTITARLFTLALERGLRSIVFTKARVVTELIHRYVLEQKPELAPLVSSYRAGFLPEERREIEAKLQSGEILGVISTSALELGIDIGGLDLCFLVGYPGTITTTWQRSGRVGRKDHPAAMILIAQQNALDQYFMRYPHDFFGRSYESAIVNRNNEEIVKAHIVAAAAEIPLMEGDDQFDIVEHKKIIDELVADGSLLQIASGKQYFPSRKNPSRHVSIRSTGNTYSIFEQGTDFRIGEVSGGLVFRECHEGAIYLHRARQYQVVSLDQEKHNVWVQQVNVPYYTSPHTSKNTEIIETLETTDDGLITAHRGILKITEQVVGFEKRKIFSQERISVHPLDLPPITFQGQGIWMQIPNPMIQELLVRGLHPMGSIHAIEHAVLSLFPLFALCDRNDVGGISFEMNPQVQSGAIFLYDGYPGGAGLSWRAFEVFRPLLEKTLSLIRDCPCEQGCPSCIHSPKCGAGNHPLDKQGAVTLLEWLLSESFQPTVEKPTEPDKKLTVATPFQPQASEPSVELESPFPDNVRILTFDLETQLSAEQVGGWQMARLMRLAIGVIHDSQDNQYHSYGEDKVEKLLDHMRQADLIVGFNLFRFDYQVLRGYTMDNLRALPTLDIFKDVSDTLGHRLSLNALATATLGAKKTADGLQSLEWFRQGKLDLVTEYCKKDVEITRNLFLYGVKHGYLLYNRKGIGDVRVPVNWNWERIKSLTQSP